MADHLRKNRVERANREQRVEPCLGIAPHHDAIERAAHGLRVEAREREVVVAGRCADAGRDLAFRHKGRHFEGVFGARGARLSAFVGDRRLV